ncbi:hypothetical protein IWW48_003578 [Coemansia sp. RSA 1200]|nr:hypothetical protein IWW48_003578 [Coemansia sp. RSA 1200]
MTGTAASQLLPKNATNKRHRSNAENEVENENINIAEQPIDCRLQTPKNRATGGRGDADVEYTAKRAKKGRYADNLASPTVARSQKSAQQQSAQQQSTQLFSRSSGLHSLSNRGTHPVILKTQRDMEAGYQVRKMLRTNIQDVLKLVRPASKSRASLAMSIGKHIAADLELRLVPQLQHQPQPRRSLRLASQSLKNFQLAKHSISKSDRAIHKAIGKSRAKLQNDGAYAEHTRRLDYWFNGLKTWIMHDYWTNGGDRPERQMYRPMQAFHLFVAQFIRYHLGDTAQGNTPSGVVGPSRLILPYEHVDVKSFGTDDMTRSDIGLAVSKMDADAALVEGRPYNNEQFAVIEAKASASKAAAESATGAVLSMTDEQDEKLDANTVQAFKQLFLYTRQVYAKQCDRRFMWGITACDTRVRVCVLTSGGALASHEMDTNTEKGHREYIQLLVNWSMCNWWQLGFDPSVRWLKDLDCWEIDVPRLAVGTDDAGQQPTALSITYYFDSVYIAASHLFGRHTRCFPASSKRPVSKELVEPEVLIKDTWSFVRRKNGGDDNTGEHGEIAFLARIRRMLDQKPEYRNNLPTLVDGGPVRLDVDGASVDDTTDLFLGELSKQLHPAGDDPSDYSYYSHNRMAMTPIGKRLRDIPSIPELILVMHDAVRAHKAVFDNCGILHRDISENNILFQHDSDGNIHGVLIDFDNAADSTAAKHDYRPICTGTLPFMSVNNLRKADVPRTPVDDMESSLYLLIWLGVLGVTIKHRERTRNESRSITDWNASIEKAILSKKLRMRSDELLQDLLAELYSSSHIVSDEELEWYSSLGNLVCELRTTIFDNPNLDVASAARGTWIPSAKKSSARATGGLIMPSMALGFTADKPDAYKARADPVVANLIHEDALAVLKWYADETRARIKRSTTASE